MKIDMLARELKKHHRQSKSWRNTGRAFGISGALAYRIALEKYDPADTVTRKKLDLGPRPCPTCKHMITAPKQYRTYKRIADLAPADLRWALDHRETLA